MVCGGVRVLLVFHDSTIPMSCSRCDSPTRVGQGYCRSCHNAYMRCWRRMHRVSEEQRVRGICRSQAGYARKKGLLVPPDRCVGCNRLGLALEMHHEDYAKPLAVMWFCRSCHASFERS